MTSPPGVGVVSLSTLVIIENSNSGNHLQRYNAGNSDLDTDNRSTKLISYTNVVREIMRSIVIPNLTLPNPNYTMKGTSVYARNGSV